MFSEKLAITLKGSGFVVNPVHDLIMNSSAKYYHCSIKKGHIVLEFLPVRVGRDWKDICSIHEVQSSV